MKENILKYKVQFFLFLLMCIPFIIFANSETLTPKATILHERPSLAPAKIEVNPQTRDEEIGKRIESIMQATNWFNEPKVTVENGVVFLTGETNHHQFKEWAGDLAHNTQDVAAIVNKIAVLEPSIVDLQIILQELLNQTRKIIRSLPGVFFGALILFLAWLAARLVYKIVPLIYRNKVNPSLLQEVIARAIAFFVFLGGVYFVFEMADLTTMALTVLSGTGLLGIILGIAFRDLAENFLASILLSLQNPFNTHDLIDLVQPTTGFTITGYVERLTLRVTILLSPDGKHVQIPNATVYKSNIINYTSNPNHRETFNVSIKYNCSVSKAVDAALKILSENEAILKNPEPLVLVDGLENESVSLQISYWIDIKKHNPYKIKSSVARLIKQAFQSEGIFQSSNAESDTFSDQSIHFEAQKTRSEVKTVESAHLEKTKGLSSQSRLPEKGENLLGKTDKNEKIETESTAVTQLKSMVDSTHKSNEKVSEVDKK